MPSDADGPDKRRHERFALDRGAQVRDGERRRRGRLRDISGGGAAMAMESELERFDQDLSNGDFVEVDVEGLMPMQGQVARTFDDGLAVAFDLDDDEQGELIDAIMSGHAGLELDG